MYHDDKNRPEITRRLRRRDRFPRFLTMSPKICRDYFVPLLDHLIFPIGARASEAARLLLTLSDVQLLPFYVM